MARFQIKKITSGRGLNLVQTDSDACIVNLPSHTTEIDTIDLDVYNFLSTGKQFNNFFEISKFDLQSNVNLNTPHEEPDYLKELMPDGSSDFIGIAQINDFVLGLTNPTAQGIRAEFTESYYLGDVLSAEPKELCGYVAFEDSVQYPDLSAYTEAASGRLYAPGGISSIIFTDRQFNTHREYQEMPIYVGIYPSSGEIYSVYQSATAGTGLSTTGIVELNNIFYPQILLSGIHFNYLAEIPVNESPSYDHYILSGASGFTYGDPLVFSNNLNLKNMYDYKWDVNATVSATLSSYNLINNNINFDQINRSIGQVLSGALKFARTYQRINVSNFNTVWLAYKCDKYYSKNETVSGETTRCIPDVSKIKDLSGSVYYEYEGLPISDNFSIVYPLVSSNNAEVSGSPIKNYEFIERIKGWNRFSYQPHHKSNFYSILLKNTGLNNNLDTLSDTTVKTKLQNSVNNIIRKMTDKLLPIHTQLLNIYWVGD